MKNIIKIAIIAATTLATSAYAKFPEGQWAGKFWDLQTGKQFAADGNCFLADGTWYNTTAPGMKGKWFVTGSEIYIHAYSSINNEVYSSQLTVINNKFMSGRHQHWSTDGSIAFFATSTLTYSSVTCLPPAN